MIFLFFFIDSSFIQYIPTSVSPPLCPPSPCHTFHPQFSTPLFPFRKRAGIPGISRKQSRKRCKTRNKLYIKVGLGKSVGRKMVGRAAISVRDTPWRHFPSTVFFLMEALGLCKIITNILFYSKMFIFQLTISPHISWDEHIYTIIVLWSFLLFPWRNNFMPFQHIP